MKKIRTILIGLVFLLLLAVAAPFFIPGPTGKHLMSFDRAKQLLNAQFPFSRLLDQIRKKAKVKAGEISKKLQFQKKPKAVEASSEQPPETLYKWRDQHGTWHFTNRPPPEGVAYTVVRWTGVEDLATDPEK